MMHYSRQYRRTIWKRLRVLWLLWCVSRKYPDQRFGQIVVNYTSSKNGASLFYAEDWLIIARLKDEIHS